MAPTGAAAAPPRSSARRSRLAAAAAPAPSPPVVDQDEDAGHEEERGHDGEPAAAADRCVYPPALSGRSTIPNGGRGTPTSGVRPSARPAAAMNDRR